MSFPDTDLAGLPPRLRDMLYRLKEGTPVNAVAASKALTFTGDAVDGNTVTINGIVFEFDTGGSITAGNVTVDVSGGAGLTAAAAALETAIEANPSCLVTAVASGGVMTATALTKGTAGNSIAISETCTNAAWAGGATALSGGIDGTIGKENETWADASYLYHCISTNTVADANWRRVSLGSAY